VTWYDENAEKVIKKVQKLKDEKLSQLLEQLGCTAATTARLRLLPTGKANEYMSYESESDLRDSESVPLETIGEPGTRIHDYFLREVKPHVPEAWIDLDKTKIGYEISFNKYFYQHKPLRPIEDVSAEILALEKENDGLIMEILNLV
jgi:type I restriction enzyme M protein